MKWNKKHDPKLNILEGGKPRHSVNGILTRYHLICDTYMVVVFFSSK